MHDPQQDSRAPTEAPGLPGKSRKKMADQNRSMDGIGILPRPVTRRITLPINQKLQTVPKELRVRNFLDFVLRDFVH